jgi:cold shock CspA family protein
MAIHQWSKSMDIHSGILKWYDNTKGYAFAIPDKGGLDVFLHYSRLSSHGLLPLEWVHLGKPVKFTLIPGRQPNKQMAGIWDFSKL